MEEFVNINDIEDKKFKTFAKNAELTKSKKGVGGRPRKDKKADVFCNVHLTVEEKSKITKYAEDKMMSVSTLLKTILKEKGII